MSERRRLHRLVYREPGLALAATVALRAGGFRVMDVHTPFPVHGMSEALGLAPTRIPYATLAGATLGAVLAFGFQAWSHVRDWPLRIGGKDMLAWPALVPVTFEVAVLLAAFATVGALVFKARLSPRGDPARQPGNAVTDDRFVVVVEEHDASFSPARFRQIVAGSGAESAAEWRMP